MKIFVTLSTLLIASASLSQNYTPISVTGYNYDVIAEATPALSTTDTAMDGSNYVLYSQAYGTSFGTGTGLPNTGLITSGSSTYQLAPYTSDNCIFLATGQTDSLELTTPSSYSSLSFLGLSTEGAGTVLFVIKFTDGSAMVVPSTGLPDWFTGTNAVISGFDRTGRIGDTPDYSTFQPYMYRINVNLSCADQAKTIQRIAIINTTSSPTIKTAIFAVSGAPVVSASSILGFHNLDCNGETNGYVQLTPSGLIPISYSWNTTPVTTTQNLTNKGAGTYTCTITDATGCSKQLTQTLTEPAAIGSSQTIFICAGESYSVGPFTHTTSGTYNDPLPAANGCDSVVTTILTVTNINNSVTISGHQLNAVASGAQYQWLNCGNGYAIVPGATGQTFSPTADGAYAVAITINNCTDTSSCLIYSTVGLEEETKPSISAAPNPVTDILTINTEETIRSVHVIDLFGKKQAVTLSDKQIYLNTLPAGIYFVTIATDSGESYVLRIIKH